MLLLIGIFMTAASVDHIRQFSDPVLHTPAQTVDFANPKHLSQLSEQLMIMRERLHATGGVGIASTQCADIEKPLQVVIVGTDLQELHDVAKQRYPAIDIPHETILINPTILDKQDAYFPEQGEGCLSVAGGFRGQVQRYKTVTVEYQDLDGDKHRETFKDFKAHITLHEFDHLHGVVFLQNVIAALSADQLQQLKQAIKQALTQADDDGLLITPKLTAYYDDSNKLIIDPDTLQTVLDSTPKVTLTGLLNYLDK